jgi:hypothetical protein
MCPLVKSKMAMRLTAAHPFRFWITGRMYGAAIVNNEIKPKTEVITMAILK